MWNAGLSVDPTTDAPKPPRLVLDKAEQRRLHDGVVRIAARTVEAESEKAVMTRIRNALAFLVEVRMREMVRDAREYELKALLTDLFGERMAAVTVERLHARMVTWTAWTHHNPKAGPAGRRPRWSSPSSGAEPAPCRWGCSSSSG